MSVETIVSIIIPAYKFQYMEQALDSVLNQTYPSLELVICDDSADGRIAELVEKKRASTSLPILYIKNRHQIGELTNTVKCIRHAQGKYIKFLHDDDVLEPECIAELVTAMENEPDVVLASSRRQRINEEGEPLPDILATSFPFSGDVLINGKELISFLGDHTINFIGEPSCIMARSADLKEIDMQMMSLNGKMIHWVGDLALYAKLLQRGNLAFLSKPLTKFRVSNSQFSQAGRDKVGIGDQGHADFRQAIRDLGWYRTSGDNRFVSVAPITRLKARTFKPINLLDALRRAVGLGSVSLSSWLEARRPIPAEQALINQRLAEQNGGPRIAVMLLNQGDAPDASDALKRSLDHLERVNLYRHIEIVVFTTQPHTDCDEKVTVITLEDHTHPVTAINDYLARSQADWLLVAEAGSEFLQSGLLMVALDLPILPDSCQAVYADELVRLNDDELGVLLRPDTNLDLLLSFPASMSPHWLFRRTALVEQGGFSSSNGRAFELAYQLRLIEQFGLGCIAHVSEPLLIANASSMQEHADEQVAIAQHLNNRGYPQASIRSHFPRCYEIDYGHTQQPFVSILVIVKDRLPQAQRCLESLLENTQYTNYEVLLLDHGNQAADMRNWLAGIEAIQAAQLRVLRFSESVSDARLRNEAAQQARGDFLLWLGDGAAVLHKDWLQQLLNHALRPEVGAVGAKLLSADGKIRHAGLLLGLNSPAGSAFEGLAHDDNGYMQRLRLDQNYSALSAECLLLRRTLFMEAGGFDEEPLLSRWTDVDLCLKLQQAGFLNVWTPRTRLLMDMPPTRPVGSAEEDAMYARWLPVLARDPAYNPGFSLQDNEGFKLAAPQLAWRPLQAWRPLPVVLAHHADPYGCGHYRIIQPTLAMCNAGLIDGTLSSQILSPTTLERFAPDVLVMQRPTSPERIEALRRMKQFSNAFKVYELDDYLPNLSMKNINKQNIDKDVLKRIRQGLAHVDRFVVSTDALKEAFAGLHADIRVIENRLPADWWGNLQGKRHTSTKPRVGWAGGNSHSGDLELIADVVRELANEVEWVFFGMCPDKLRPYIHELHAGIPIQQYPQALADLNLDLALAPVEDHLFNQCKSNLRLLEYGACGFPVICSDVRCYQYDDLPATRVKNRFSEWVNAIRMHLADPQENARRGDALQAIVRRNWMLADDNLLAWRKAWLPD
ncbi:glycosyltransferase [Oxalicibacterium faecigallinarum]|uniref:O-antigen biosynthesis protein n=1 Tax=Oxalicibacterium faecigallinarum TaxID=573741 RepID=A0A8J3ASR7_9BURK|nr:glycosyltransferase [Oxalicibacterium faecigallinarum]GGI20992.1 O-antigen biosynthesis protein [Oxalicibacterium faecigallinarum]